MATPTLILLPGLHGTEALFRPLTQQIPPHVQTRVITHPTHHICLYETLFQRVQQQLAGEKDMVLLGESFSGPLALRFAAENPDRVRGVVLCCSFIGPPVPRALCLLGAPFALIRFPIFNFLIRWFLAGHSAAKSLVRDVRHEIYRVRPDVLAHRVASAAWIDGREALRRCTVPILCLAGTRDRLVGPRSIRRLRRVRNDVEVHPIDAPHLLLQERPAQAWRLISAFLQKMSRP